MSLLLSTILCLFLPPNGALSTLLNSNARSIVNKIDEMTEIIENNKADIACVTETWLSNEIPPCVTDIDGYTCERRNRVDRRGGCVLTYIRNSISYHRLSILECDEVGVNMASED